MNTVTYQIIRHDGGWAYRVSETISETFPTHDGARRAAERAAIEQTAPDQPTTIHFEDSRGRWHTERSNGHDKPTTRVKG